MMHVGHSFNEMGPPVPSWPLVTALHAPGIPAVWASAVRVRPVRYPSPCHVKLLTHCLSLESSQQDLFVVFLQVLPCPHKVGQPCSLGTFFRGQDTIHSLSPPPAPFTLPCGWQSYFFSESRTFPEFELCLFGTAFSGSSLSPFVSQRKPVFGLYAFSTGSMINLQKGDTVVQVCMALVGTFNQGVRGRHMVEPGCKVQTLFSSSALSETKLIFGFHVSDSRISGSIYSQPRK